MLKTIVLFIFLILVSFQALAATTAYSSTLDDLPLMQGMSERPEDTIVFDNPGGRIMEFSAETAEQAPAIRDFYQRALPPLGWKPAGASQFVRDKEMLKIEFDKKGEGTIVRFAVTPSGGN
jgi:hypothetical protein